MEFKNKAQFMGCCHANRCSVVGMILIVLATIMTIVTMSGLGIFGMFIVGLAMSGHKYWAHHDKSLDEACDDHSHCEVKPKETKKTTKKSV